MITYKATISDRNYSNWEFYKTTDFTLTDLSISPLEHKLFSGDVFTVNNNNLKRPEDAVEGEQRKTVDDSRRISDVSVVHSSVRSCDSIPGVLILEGTKTYGRHRNGKLLYKCIPDDMRLPCFLIPYEIKHVGFSKIFPNNYITFNYVEWTNKHPIGVISQLIGPIDVIDNYYEYQLYCKSLNASIQKFTKDTSKIIKTVASSHDVFIESIRKKHPNIEDRTSQLIFTIDPPKSVDFDDGFSICKIDNNGLTQIKLSIYISNVTIWMDSLNLWDSFSKRISTIYLPDRKRPMLPTILSDCLCSLQSNNTRIAFVMDIIIEDGTICDIQYSNAMIRVHKNYCYEDPELLSTAHYQLLLHTAQCLTKTYKYMNNVRNSHELVAYLMVLMNYNCAKELLKSGTGIFRSTIMKKTVSMPDNLPEDVNKFIKIWNSSSGQYIDVSKIDKKCDSDQCPLRHELLEMDAYVHITSPIRRLVDLLNIIKLQKSIGIITLSENAHGFYDKWLADLEYINTTMRSIRKVQNDCSMLDFCMNSPDIMEKEYDGYIFDKMERSDGLYQVVVYLPELKLTSRVTTRHDMENYEKYKFKLFLFHNEEKFKKKIRLHLV